MVYVKKQFEEPSWFTNGGSWQFKYDGKHITFGPWDGKATQPAKGLRNEFDRLVEECRQHWRAKHYGVQPPPEKEGGLRIAEIILAWINWLQTEPPPDGLSPS